MTNGGSRELEPSGISPRFKDQSDDKGRILRQVNSSTRSRQLNLEINSSTRDLMEIKLDDKVTEGSEMIFGVLQEKAKGQSFSA